MHNLRLHRSATYCGNISDNSSCCVTIIGRTESVVDQAEAKRAFKRRNSIKKRMIRKIGKSFENLAARRDSKPDERCNIIQEEVNTVCKKVDEKAEKDSSSDPKGPPCKLIRSMSDVGLIKLASLKFRRKNETVYGGGAKKKDMIKNWNRTYVDMCDRAQKLELGNIHSHNEVFYLLNIINLQR